MTLPRSLANPLPVAAFALLSASPVGLIGLGCVYGGLWTALAFLAMTLLPLAMDRLLPWVAGNAAEGVEFPAEAVLLLALGILHLTLLPLVVWAVGGPGFLDGPDGLSGAERLALFIAAGLWFGQVAHPAAHELIHRQGQLSRALGVAIYVTLLIGHHASAHRLVHHHHVASARDPNTARAGEGYYRYAWRAWLGSFRAGFRAETLLRIRSRSGLHPYWVYLGGAGVSLALGLLLAGLPGLLVWAGLGFHATAQILLSDYVQHYGLRRRKRPDGKLEPVGPAHSWNAAPWYSSGLMLNAPRHSDHHAHPARRYPALQLPDPDLAPRLPWSLPLACLIALLPPVWRRAMQPHLAGWNPPKPLN